MREWTEKHIRELIDDEFKKLKKPTVGGGVELQINSGRTPSDFFYYDNNNNPVFFNEEDLDGIILFDRHKNFVDNSSIEYYNFKFLNERAGGREYNIRTYELFDGVMKFDDRLQNYFNNQSYLTSIPNGQFIRLLREGTRLLQYWNIEYLSPFEISEAYLLQNDNKYELRVSRAAQNSGSDNKFYIDDKEYDLYTNGRTAIYKGSGAIMTDWATYDYDKPAKLIVESYRFIT